ncbi:class I lanthipeptide [Chitinophaga sp. HK235]|uniref:class I lanthipeptide n=1 Tax=Chitinophaga sp. HK235 TaxID=2952571 RepID=UPI001BA654F7|nr:class I lanthipeptide [Chitinophaga sp. HK235]
MKKQTLNNAKKITLKKMTVAPLNASAQAAVKGGIGVSAKCVTIADITCIDCNPSFSGCLPTFTCE